MAENPLTWRWWLLVVLFSLMVIEHGGAIASLFVGWGVYRFVRGIRSLVNDRPHLDT